MAEEMKMCYRCGIKKDVDNFHRDKSRWDGRSQYCKTCRKEVSHNWEVNNKEKREATKKEWKNKNRVKINLERTERGHVVRERIPAWADRVKIMGIYTECDGRRKLGEDVSVDHVIPLKGTLASGLHVHNNLRIIPSSENSSKCNRFDPMAEES